jgi:transketolase
MEHLEEVQQKAKLVRKWCLISTTEAGSGHPTSCLSAADLGTVLFDRYFTYDLEILLICITIALFFPKDI